MPENSELEYYQLWLKKAAEDELVVRNLLEAGGPYSPTCFHCQQMAEKLLKSLLIFKRQEFPKNHDLLALLTILQSFLSDVEDIHTDLDYLNNFYTEARYPDDYHTFTKNEAEEAFKRALKVKAYVISKIEL